MAELELMAKEKDRTIWNYLAQLISAVKSSAFGGKPVSPQAVNPYTARIYQNNRFFNRS